MGTGLGLPRQWWVITALVAIGTLVGILGYFGFDGGRGNSSSVRCKSGRSFGPGLADVLPDPPQATAHVAAARRIIGQYARERRHESALGREASCVERLVRARDRGLGENKIPRSVARFSG
jgi:hypothetical protein